MPRLPAYSNPTPRLPNFKMAGQRPDSRLRITLWP